ncbi:MAG: acyl-ACP thioesterase [Alistipes sp.]|nr:acyl-ACP thioesterase [Alistipes sp.]
MADKSIFQYRVEPQEVDFTFHARLDALCAFMLNSAGADAQHRGFGVDALMSKNRAWVLSRMAVEIDRFPKQYEETRLNTWVNDNGVLLSTRNFEFVDAAGEIFVRAVSQWCLIDYERRVPVALTECDSFSDDKLCTAQSPCSLPRKIRNVEPTEHVSRRAVYSDIDFNYHVNTMRYLAMMLDVLPIEMLASNRPLRLDVHFMHECRLGQLLTVGYRQQDDVSLFEITTDDDTVACRATIEWR